MLFYITFIDFGCFFGTGMDKKIKGQIEALKESLGEIYLTAYAYPFLYLMNGDEVVEKEIAVTRRDRAGILCEWMDKYKVTKTYIRYAHSDKWFIDLLRYQKEHHIKTVLEIATYPYDKESDDGIGKTEDMCYREEISRYIDRITTYSSDDVIWDVPCIRLVNGISPYAISVSKRIKEDNRIVMIAISSMQFWHGYERILEGMYLYHKKNGPYGLFLKIVGNGPEEQRYKELTARYGLQQQVEFLGRIEPWEKEKLDEQYDRSDIAVGTLGFYKTGVMEASPIKGAEYCAKGIPFICGYRDLRFQSDEWFLLNVPNDPDPVDMDLVIEFYQKVTSDKDHKQKMRDFAMDHLTWSRIMQPVADHFLQD